jgi:hypothetical protein
MRSVRLFVFLKDRLERQVVIVADLADVQHVDLKTGRHGKRSIKASQFCASRTAAVAVTWTVFGGMAYSFRRFW